MIDLVKTSGVKVIDATHGKNYSAFNADCVEGIRGIPNDSIDFSVYSPPFAALFVFSDSDHDMGNCGGLAQFMETYAFLMREKLRVTKPGRLSAVHCMNLSTSLTTHGVIGLQDFRGEIIRMHVANGWVYHSEICIWKDPVAAMQRTKNHGLLHKTYVSDAAMSRQGLADYVMIFRKPGKNQDPVRHVHGPTEEDKRRSIKGWQIEASPIWPGKDEPHDDAVWNRYADPLWLDIVQSDTLDFRVAREEKDEKHICPLQLTVIRRVLHIWTNPGDVVLSPFMGIGSEGFVALEQGRKFIGFELKGSYFAQAKKNLAKAEPTASGKQMSLLDMAGV